MSAFDELKSAIEGMQSGRYVLDIKCISANFRKFEAEFSQLQARAENAEALKVRLDACLGLTKYTYLDHIGECNPKKTGTCTCGYWDARNKEIEEATKFEAMKAGAK